MKRGKYEPGDMVELHRNGRYGYCRALVRDEFSTMFEIFDYITEKSIPLEILGRLQLPLKGVSYVNDKAAKKAWRYIGNVALLSINPPPVFDGHPNYGWTIYDKGVKRRVSASEVTEDSLLEQGYVPQILWLPKRIEDFLFEGKELRWNWNP
jgi:hypothetical protein